MAVASTVMLETFASRGRLAMCSTVWATCSTSISGSGTVSPFGWSTPWAMCPAIGVKALPMSIWPQAMSYFLPSRAVALVSPVMACFVEVYGDELGRGVWAEMDPLLMILPPRGSWSFMSLNASRVQ